MDDYTREMMDLKTLVTRTLEKKGVLAKIRGCFGWEARGIRSANLTKALTCPVCDSGRLLTALVCEYLDWAQLNHTLKVYQPECNLQKDSWKAELKDFSIKNGYDLNRNGDNPVLMDVLDCFLKFELDISNVIPHHDDIFSFLNVYNNLYAWKICSWLPITFCQNLTQARGSGRRSQEIESSSSSESRNTRRPSSSTVVGGLPPLGRAVPASQSSDRRASSSMSGYRKEEYSWRYDDDLPEDVIRASAALENLQLDRKARNVTSSWRHAGDSVSGDDDKVDHM
ncbi:protein TONNEAU 1b-like [Gossypium australe]|uniref:Protein TONNEAU 1b-like n=1 Tax=Gossypium australe TaxID=47621 RepID=A0A5B6WKQ2_9ROSI|nr:protein TONNEAU 1b-like [Gossypium australe]